MFHFKVFFGTILLLSISIVSPGLAQEKADATEARMKALAADANFKQLLEVLNSADARIEERFEAMPESEQGKVLAELEALLRELDGSEGNQPYPELFEELSGLSQEEFEAVSELRTAVHKAYPEFDSIAEIGQTRDDYVEENKGNGPCRQLDGLEECYCLCDRETERAKRESEHELLANASENASTGLALYALGKYYVGVWNTHVDKKACRKACREDNPACQVDSDCASNQFCAKPVDKRNQCEPLRRLGEVCSRHGKCDSGCCKYYPLFDLFSKVCRPADKCD